MQANVCVLCVCVKNLRFDCRMNKNYEKLTLSCCFIPVQCVADGSDHRNVHFSPLEGSKHTHICLW